MTAEEERAHVGHLREELTSLVQLRIQLREGDVLVVKVSFDVIFNQPMIAQFIGNRIRDMVDSMGLQNVGIAVLPEGVDLAVVTGDGGQRALREEIAQLKAMVERLLGDRR